MVVCRIFILSNRKGIKMAKKVAIGIQDFEYVIKNNFFYIDKTNFIKE